MAHATTPADWTTEDAHWRKSYRDRPYAEADRGYEFYEPAYRYGFESSNRYQGRSWNDAQSDLERGWDNVKDRGKSTWQQVKDAVRDSWDRATKNREV